MIWILLAMLFFCIMAGAIYPLLMIVLYKIRYGKKASLRWILKEIGW